LKRLPPQKCPLNLRLAPPPLGLKQHDHELPKRLEARAEKLRPRNCG
jgi:hypothetical protein